MKCKANTLITAGLLLLAAAVFVGIHNLNDERRAEGSAESLARRIEAELPAEKTYAALKAETESGEQTEMAQAQEIPDYVVDPEMDMPVLKIDGNLCIGILEIPSQSLILPVISEWSYSALKLSPCRFSGSAYLDDMIILAHNYPRHFGGLKDLYQGDEIIFTDAAGNVFLYTVSESQRLGPMDIDELNDGEWDLTLLTCTVGGHSRVTVRCERAENAANVSVG